MKALYWQPATAEQAEQLRRWIQADATHCGVLKPEFFYAEEAGTEKWMVCDEHGNVMVYFRLTHCLRIHMQFPPNDEVSRDDLQQTMLAIFPAVVAASQEKGLRQLIFDSVAAPLIRFCEKRFGFRRSRHELVLNLAPAEAGQAQENAAQVVQHNL